MLFLQETGRESISTSEQQASSGRTDSQLDGEGDGKYIDLWLPSMSMSLKVHFLIHATGEMREDLYEEAFARMKKAAGVSDIDEVVRRFETQEETTNHLLELQVIIHLVIK